MDFVLRSSAFPPQGKIPRVYTCEGRDVSPPLAWAGVPAGTKTLALTVVDPDAPDPAAPRMTWVHWVVYDMPAGVTAIPEGGPLPAGAREGRNDWKRTGWGGPCPPIGRHRYVFTLYALDTELGDLGTPTRGDLEAAMAGHVLDRTQLIGTYQKGD